MRFLKKVLSFKLFGEERTISILTLIQIVGIIICGITLVVLISLVLNEAGYSDDSPYLPVIYSLIPIFAVSAKVRLKEDSNEVYWTSLICFFLGWAVGGLLLWWSTFLTSNWVPVIVAVSGEFFGASIAGLLLVTTDL